MQSLLISGCNEGGGLALWHDGTLEVLRHGGTTGLAANERWLAVAQGQTIYLLEHDADPVQLRFHRQADLHDLSIDGNRLFVVATGGNQVLEIDLKAIKLKHNWKFASVRDSWHLNCLGMIGGELCFSAFGEFSEHRGYKGASEGKGFIAKVADGEKVISDLTHPHSICAENRTVWTCNSSRQEVIKIENGERISSGDLGGYTRGLALSGGRIAVGISSLRGIIERSGGRSSSVAILDRDSLEEKSRFSVPFPEIYEILPLSSGQVKAARDLATHMTQSLRWLNRLTGRSYAFKRVTKC